MGLQLRTRDGTVIDVPATLKAITTFILFEQEQWFEKELGFLLAWVKPDMTAIDIGANLGVYSLPLARRGARVIAYEPASESLAQLEKSRALNAASALEIAASAVSDSVRKGHLVIESSSEANRLGDEGAGEEVAITSLDHEDSVRGWSPDIVKIDAEGEELRIVEGGRRFFARHSPLVMFEVRAGAAFHAEAAHALGDLGYRTYRSLPSTPLLVPCDADEDHDPYELNLFAAKPDRAAALAVEGHLLNTVRPWTPYDAARETGLSLLKAQRFSGAFPAAHGAPLDAAYTDALAGYAAWRTSRDYGALAFAVALLSGLCDTEPNLARLASLARIAAEAGMRGIAVKSLEALSGRLKAGETAITEPFWPASTDAEASPPGLQNANDWFIAQALEQKERLARYSTYWGSSDINLEWLAGHAWVPTEMLRRHVLSLLRADHRAVIPERLCRPAPDHLNARLWQSGLVRFAARDG